MLSQVQSPHLVPVGEAVPGQGSSVGPDLVDTPDLSYIVANTSACLRTLHFNSGTGSLVFPRRASSVLSSIPPGGDVACVAETTEIGPRVVTNKEGICTEY
jgi:hypothetical protein